MVASSINGTDGFEVGSVSEGYRFIATAGKGSHIPATVFAVLVAAVLTLLHRTLLEPLLYGRLSHVPGPKLAGLSWYYLSYFDMCFCRNQKIGEWHRIYGPVVRIRPHEVTLANPADYREIYDTKSRYDKSTFFKRFTIYGEDNLFSTVSYIDHQAKKRKIAADYAKTNVIRNAESIVRERIAAFVAEISAAPKGLVDFFELLDCFSHDVMTRFLYGPTHGTDAIRDPAERPLVSNLKKAQIWSPLWVNFGWLHGSWLARLYYGDEYRKFFSRGNEVKEAIAQKMLQHDDDPDHDEDYSLYRTMRLAHKEGDHLSRNYMASEMYDHLKAGQQTTASTLTYLFWRLSRHPDWQRRVQEELRSLPVDEKGELAFSDLEASPILSAVVKETMRLHPVATGRQERIVPAEGRSYSGVYVPAGTTVIGPTLVLHHDPDVYERPIEWLPARWLEASKEQRKVMDYSFVPFGHGARICIGQHLAMLEILSLTASLYRRFSTSLGEGCTDDSMHQLGTLSAVPRALKCELSVNERVV